MKVTDKRTTGKKGTDLVVGLPQAPEFAGTIPPTPQKAIDEALKDLQANKNAWVGLSIGERVGILDQIKRDLMMVADRWIAASVEAKGIPRHTMGEGEEWAMLGGVFRMVRLLRRSLLDIQKHGFPQIPGPVTTRPDGQMIVQVFPQTRFESIIYKGIRAEVWMEPGVTPEECFITRAPTYLGRNYEGKVTLVFGAGNASLLPPFDFLSKLFVEDQVVVLKFNPVNDYLGPLFEDAFRALINKGFFKIVYGGVKEGSYLCNHKAVDYIHLTGSDKTFETIVFGPGPEGAKRKAERKRLNTKHITGELGCVSPVIVVPGPWNEDEVREQALHLALMLWSNAGFNCLTPRIIIQHKSWIHRDQLLKSIGGVLTELKTRKAYYPGAKDRHAAFVAEHPNALQFGTADDDHLPWTLIADVNPADADDICFKTEAFCSLFAETALEAQSIPEFVDRSVEFANETLWGTLSATIIVHPESLNDQKVAAAVKGAISNLRYGTICVNMFSGLVGTLATTPWGAFPGQNVYNVQSGIGVVGNFLMFDRPQKSVYRAPFNKKLNPLTLLSKHGGHEIAKKLAAFEASPSFWKLPSLLWSALRS